MFIGGIITVVICIYEKTCNQFFIAKDTEKYACRNIHFCERRNSIKKEKGWYGRQKSIQTGRFRVKKEERIGRQANWKMYLEIIGNLFRSKDNKVRYLPKSWNFYHCCKSKNATRVWPIVPYSTYWRALSGHRRRKRLLVYHTQRLRSNDIWQAIRVNRPWSPFAAFSRYHDSLCLV